MIDIDDTGYRFDVEIAGSPSEGISKMKIFCYDLMLIAFARQRGLGMDFLIHDSTIFDGVDPRQRAHALELAAAMAQKYGFQYICTLNTDMVPVDDFSATFDHTESVRLARPTPIPAAVCSASATEADQGRPAASSLRRLAEGQAGAATAPRLNVVAVTTVQAVALVTPFSRTVGGTHTGAALGRGSVFSGKTLTQRAHSLSSQAPSSRSLARVSWPDLRCLERWAMKELRSLNAMFAFGGLQRRVY